MVAAAAICRFRSPLSLLSPDRTQCQLLIAFCCQSTEKTQRKKERGRALPVSGRLTCHSSFLSIFKVLYIVSISLVTVYWALGLDECLPQLYPLNYIRLDCIIHAIKPFYFTLTYRCIYNYTLILSYNCGYILTLFLLIIIYLEGEPVISPGNVTFKWASHNFSFPLHYHRLILITHFILLSQYFRCRKFGFRCRNLCTRCWIIFVIRSSIWSYHRWLSWRLQTNWQTSTN